MNTDLIAYYQARASEYERIYQKPERQHDLAIASEIFQDIFTNKDVFEIACGTGYWTGLIAKTSRSIFATDINESVIQIAKAKQYLPAKVTFQTADIFNLTYQKKYQSLFGGFVWSHIPLQDIVMFIDVVNSQVECGGTVVFIDNKFVEGSSTPISDKDEFNNTYQMRKLDDGTVYKVLKNFPSKALIRNVLCDKAKDIRFISLEYFWIIEYKVK